MAKELWAYIGRRISQRDTAIYGYANVANLGLAEPFYYRRPIVSGIAIGAIMEVTLTEDRSIFTKGEDAPKFTREFVDSATIAHWIALDKASSVQLAELAQAKKRMKTAPDPIDKHIFGLRVAMRGMNMYQRAAFVKYVESQLHG